VATNSLVTRLLKRYRLSTNSGAGEDVEIQILLQYPAFPKHFRIERCKKWSALQVTNKGHFCVYPCPIRSAVSFKSLVRSFSGKNEYWQVCMYVQQVRLQEAPILLDPPVPVFNLHLATLKLGQNIWKIRAWSQQRSVHFPHKIADMTLTYGQ
jgi:hypothetical protein